MLIKFEANDQAIYIPYVKNTAEDSYWKACVGPALNRLVLHAAPLAITNGWDEPMHRNSLEYSSIYGRGATIYMKVAPIDVSAVLAKHPELQSYIYPTEQEHRYLAEELAKYGCTFLWAVGIFLLPNRYSSTKIISNINDAVVNTLAYYQNKLLWLADYRPEYEYNLPNLNSSSMLRCHKFEDLYKIFDDSGVIPYESESYFQLIEALQDIDQQFLSKVK